MAPGLDYLGLDISADAVALVQETNMDRWARTGRQPSAHFTSPERHPKLPSLLQPADAVLARRYRK
jgi:hypothetical protein